MEKEQYMPKDSKAIVFTNVLLFCQEDFEEIHIGGRLNSVFVTHLPAFKIFADKRLEKDISISVFSYALNGGSGQERKATKEEMEMIIDYDFPYNYDASILRCIDHDGPDQFVIRNNGDSWFIVAQDGVTELLSLYKGQMEYPENEGMQLR